MGYGAILRVPGKKKRWRVLAWGFVAAAEFTAVASAQAPRMTGDEIDPAQVQVLPHYRPMWATVANDMGSVAPDLTLKNMTIVLARSPLQQAAVDNLLVDQQNPASPEYHHWLAPNDVGERFGLADKDIENVTGWLQSQGLQVTQVAQSRTFINFSGSAVNVGRAFKTELHYYNVEGEQRMAASSDPSVPSALAPAIKAIQGLSTIHYHSESHTSRHVASPAETSGGAHYLAPGDFATIYDVPSTWTGAGVTVGIVGRSRTDFADFSNFRNLTGTTFANPTEIIPTAYGGADPGPAQTSCTTTPCAFSNDQLEATFDVLRVGSTAPGAKIQLVVSATTGSNGDGIIPAMQYLVDTTPVPVQVISISFGTCELNASESDFVTWTNFHALAAMEGISVFVSSDDVGVSGCDISFITPPSSPGAASTNLLCTSQFNTCVGGTEFNDTSDPEAYWGTFNNANFSSALQYIPEGAWNEPYNYKNQLQVAATGGGVSTWDTPTPYWQIGTGVPAARTGRYVPDVSFSSSGHDAYLGCFASDGTSPTQTDSCVLSNGTYYFETFEGTSAAAPGMAGITALLDQKLGSAQGNITPQLYEMATGYPTAFHDVTVSSSGVTSCSASTPSMCNNSIASSTGVTGGEAGYQVTTGYDEVTGLGSLDVGLFLNYFPQLPAISGVSVNPTVVASGSTLNLTVTLTSPAPPPGADITLVSSNSALIPVTSMTIPGGSTSATIPVVMGTVAVSTSASIQATYFGSQIYTVFTLNPNPVIPSALPTEGGGFNQPWGVALDASGNIYVADEGNNAVKEIPQGCASSNCVLTLGGGFNRPFGVAVDTSGNVYVADTYNLALKEMPPNCFSSTCVKTLVSGGILPSSVAVDGKGNLYLTLLDVTTNQLREMPVGCSSTTCMVSLGAGFDGPVAVAVDSSGNIYVADSLNHLVKEVTPGCTSSSCVTTLGGGFNEPYGVAVDSSGDVYVADTFNNAVKEMPPGCTSSACVTTLGAEFNEPSGIAVDSSGDVYVADTNNNAIKEIVVGISSGDVLLGSAPSSISVPFYFSSGGSGISVSVVTEGAKGLDFADAGTGTCDTNGSTYLYAAGNTCTVNVTFTPKFPGPRNGAVELLSEAGNVLAMAFLHGTGHGPELAFGPPTTRTTLGAGFSYPIGAAVDASGNIYVADYANSAVKEMPAGCTSLACVTTLGGGFSYPVGVAVDGEGNIYIADSIHNAVKIMPPGCNSSSCVGTLTGTFDSPTGVAVDGSGDVYVADEGDNAVKRISHGCISSGSSNCVTTLGGGFSSPYGVAVDASGNLYVADEGNSAVKELTAGCTSSSCVTTLGGGFNHPTGVAVDASGAIYVADYANGAVKEMPAGCSNSACVTTLQSLSSGTASGMAIDESGNVYYTDVENNVVAELNLATPPSLTFAGTHVDSQSGPQTIWLRNIGNVGLVFPIPGTGENPAVSAGFTLDGSTTCPEVLASSLGAPVLAAGGGCNLAVDFSPTTTGQISGSVALTDNNLAGANATVTQTVALVGTGLAASTTTPTVNVTPASSSITTVQSDQVTIAVDGGSGIPTGSVVLSSGTYTSSPATLTSGSATMTIPAGSLAAGNETLTATYTPDTGSSSTYNSASGTAPVITVSQAIGSCATANPNPNPNPASFAAVSDFNGDCKSDVLWRNTSTQQVYEWFMNGTTYPSSGSPGSPTSDWVIQGAGDFNGDGKSDILWRNSTTGEVFIWIMNGGTFTSSGSLGYVSSDWSVAGIGDFNGDGKADILWWNSSTGQVYVWFINGTTMSGGGSISYVSGGWTIQGIGDFNGDGKADILWRNSSTGQVFIWLMNGTTLTSSGSVSYVTSDWSIVGVGDFNGDGKSDILWRNSGTGQVYVWFINGTTMSAGDSVSYVSSDWVIQGLGDYDGSGRAGILWRNSTTQQVYIWLMNGATLTGSGTPGAPDAIWQIAP